MKPAAVVSKEVIKEYKGCENTIVKNRQGLLDCYNNLEKAQRGKWQKKPTGKSSLVARPAT